MDPVDFQNKSSQDFLEVGHEPNDDPVGTQISLAIQGSVPGAGCATSQLEDEVYALSNLSDH